MRNRAATHEVLRNFELNLDGLNIYTEAASGHYIYGPILAALAGARHVTAQVRDTRFGLAKNIIASTEKLASSYGVGGVVECVDQRVHSRLADADIVTNSGHVRPIDRDLLDVLKPTAVIPLMWETWEFREHELDLERCKELGILVLGTDESVSPCDMRSFIGLSGLKLLMELDYDGGDVLLLGNTHLLGMTLANAIRSLGAGVTWFADDPAADFPYADLRKYFNAHGENYSHLFVAEHKNRALLLGDTGILEFNNIAEVNEALSIAVMCGNIDAEGLARSGLKYAPKAIAPFGFMSYQPAMLGPRPVMTLYAGGLKVGEQMARARLQGQTPREAAATALLNSPAMDFIGKLKWTTD